MSGMDTLGELFTTVQAWLFETTLQPVMFAIGLGQLLAEGYDATGWLLLGLLQLLVLACVIGPLQRWRPVEPLTDRATVRTDIVYTLLHRLGLFRVAMFFLLEPALNGLFSGLRVAGLPTLHLDAFWPGVSDLPWVSLLLYLVVLDALNYGVHRSQHSVGWWWQLHALHHAQRQMTMWSDNRNHLLDDVLRDLIVIVMAQLIGIAPGQYVLIVALTQLSESFQHANLRLWFGPLGERLWVSPRFHRMHHAIGRSERQNCNFGVLLPWWDMLFGTADFNLRYEPTGVLDQTTQGRDYGRGLLAQQWLGLKRLVGRA
jgi:sterol desaturase/sphingolipid hydroxylase (fatty acid hydroxylase superfamily)